MNVILYAYFIVFYTYFYHFNAALVVCFIKFCRFRVKKVLEKRLKKWRKIRVTKEEFLKDLDGAKEPRRVSMRSEEAQRNSEGQVESYTVNPSYRQRTAVDQSKEVKHLRQLFF